MGLWPPRHVRVSAGIRRGARLCGRPARCPGDRLSHRPRRGLLRTTLAAHMAMARWAMRAVAGPDGPCARFHVAGIPAHFCLSACFAHRAWVGFHRRAVGGSRLHSRLATPRGLVHRCGSGPAYRHRLCGNGLFHPTAPAGRSGAPQGHRQAAARNPSRAGRQRAPSRPARGA